jgi:hypothetical protein
MQDSNVLVMSCKCHTLRLNIKQPDASYPKIIKIKAKLFLCLTKYHTMKMYPVLNLAPCHEDVFESGGTAPHVLTSALDGGRWSAL